MKFCDIPPLIGSGTWECNYRLGSMDRVLTEWEQESGLNLVPDFQRGHVWTEAQQSAFMQYCLRGGQSGLTMYFNQPGWHYGVKAGAYNDFVCVDGLQRITAIRRFLRGEIPAFGKLYPEFEDTIIKAPNVTGVRLNVNALQTRAEVLNWYLQMNDGGTPHAPEELARVRGLLAQESSYSSLP
ncbi:DUF262 domain-containing protein [Hymenobacter sp. YC55]|uniref:DUF262 domain-containing protein n=1 Tax=Hymenobacter sp. YC55 TaxID=3034019 RepID=UPI0023F66D53|nr:DUF262 domain-containing protein [Hymenobacter sp. YC55]MDF7815296.1 DUF262 domain-containing protein [Hymenobacter sp. YC55]